MNNLTNVNGESILHFCYFKFKSTLQWNYKPVNPNGLQQNWLRKKSIPRLFLLWSNLLSRLENIYIYIYISVLMEKRQSLLSLTRRQPDIGASGEQLWKHQRTWALIHLSTRSSATHDLTHCNICPSVQSPCKDISWTLIWDYSQKTAAGRAGITVSSCHFYLAGTWYDHTSGIIIILAHCTASLHVVLIYCRWFLKRWLLLRRP